MTDFCVVAFRVAGDEIRPGLAGWIDAPKSTRKLLCLLRDMMIRRPELQNTILHTKSN